MIESLKTWWQNHSAGERWLMAALGSAMAIVFLWLGVWRPVENGLAAGWDRQGASLDRYASVSAKVAALKAMPAKPKDAGRAPLDQLVSQTAAEAGFTLDRVGNQGGGRMSVSIASARTAPLLAWLQQIEQAGVIVQSINIVPGATDGTVAAQAVFQEAAP